MLTEWTPAFARNDGNGRLRAMAASLNDPAIHSPSGAAWTGSGYGALAQLGERYTGSVEVSGSIPLGSTILLRSRGALGRMPSEALAKGARGDPSLGQGFLRPRAPDPLVTVTRASSEAAAIR